MGIPGEDRTVFVIDDDEAALDSLVALLRSEALAARGFGSPCDFLDAVGAEARGCVITDLQMPEMNGVDLIRALKAAGCPLPVIMITGHADVGRVVDAMKAGAADFIEKPYEPEAILRVVRACLEQSDADADASATRNLVRRRMESLTTRERQVLDLVLEGASNKVIAARLEISPRTVEIYRANVMMKMRADSLSELVRMTLLARTA